jgi:predicted RNase H-like HicB family nuclease
MEANIMEIVYPAILYKRKGSYTLNFPDLPKCTTRGASLDEVIPKGKSAVDIWLFTQLNREETLPRA